MYPAYSLSLFVTIYLLLCAANVVTCFTVKNHDIDDKQCVIVKSNYGAFERCKLVDRAKVAVCEDAGFVGVRSCLPAKLGLKSCLRCLVDTEFVVHSKKYEDGAVVAALASTGRIWTSGSVSINSILFQGLNEIILPQSESIQINNQTYNSPKLVKSRTKRRVRVGGWGKSSSRVSSSRTTYHSSSTYHHGSSFHFFSIGGYHHGYSGTGSGGGANPDEVVIFVIVLVVLILIVCIFWAWVESGYQESYEEKSTTVVREESV